MTQNKQLPNTDVTRHICENTTKKCQFSIVRIDLTMSHPSRQSTKLLKQDNVNKSRKLFDRKIREAESAIPGGSVRGLGRCVKARAWYLNLRQLFMEITCIKPGSKDKFLVAKWRTTSIFYIFYGHYSNQIQKAFSFYFYTFTPHLKLPNYTSSSRLKYFPIK